MILLCGIPSETPMRMVREQLAALGAETILFNQRNFARTAISYEVGDTGVSGTLRLDAREIPLVDIGAVYVRMMDDRALPELRGLPDAAPERAYCRGVHDALTRSSREPLRVNGIKRLQALPGAAYPSARIFGSGNAHHE